MNDENLYQIVRDKICDWIYEGYYEDGDRIPAERELAQMLNVSRVTIRRCLTELEEERLIQREVGRGTRITFRNCGHRGELDMIVLVAPARNPFFSEFIGKFQSCAEERGALLLYVEKPCQEVLEDCLYRLYKRGLRNVVVWLEDIRADLRKLSRLRALGMNMVFFDSDQGFPYADCVTLDNGLAVRTLYEELKRLGCERIGYIGWDAFGMYSIREREKAYHEKAQDDGKGVFLRAPWTQRRRCEAIVRDTFEKDRDRIFDAVICSDREMGEAVLRAAAHVGAEVMIATVDEVTRGIGREVVVYRQNLEAVVEQIFASLQKQCVDGRNWSPKLMQIEGTLYIQKG